MAKELLFVCTFNAGRSVTSEYVVRRMLQERDQSLAQQVRTSSAGLVTKEAIEYIKGHGLAVPRPFFGRPPHGYLIPLMARRGIDITGHRSRGLNRVLLDQADMTIVFEQDQMRTVSSFWPQAKGKVFLFEEFIEGKCVATVDSCPQPIPDGDFVDYDIDSMAPIIADIERCWGRTIDKILNHLGVSRARGA